jgi:hypothetical protein
MFQKAALTVALFLLLSADALAHCDTMNGPVVKSARLALDNRDVRFALVWVRPVDEVEIRSAFERALSVRGLGAEAKALADRYFFETLVRVHRAGEGAPFTGLKDTDVLPEPSIAAAERSLEVNSVRDLSNELTTALQQKIDGMFQQVQRERTFEPADVEAGRRYVAKYVGFIHYVERLHKAILSAGGEHHSPNPEHIP